MQKRISTYLQVNHPQTWDVLQFVFYASVLGAAGYMAWHFLAFIGEVFAYILALLAKLTAGFAGH